ncbi:hypothetical protein D779_2122 [Imhoffiella purpurea]|uniref:Uncharacterized protein n=1 Tax=Imhoffiella purpurea TaxID=1249627 RepID=W9VD59_9GAMM|nr:hypothetical protein D779_2122 [Imhoffiella purpurea]
MRSMHDGIAVWEGCGSCGAEPYWIEIGVGMVPESDVANEDGR